MIDFSFLADWYVRHCDGDWEHGGGIALGTLDNPGWRLAVDIEGTEADGVVIETQVVERSEDDWLHYWCDGSTFHVACGPRNVNELLTVFESFVRENSTDLA